LTIGVFDGVHRGHQLLFNELKKFSCKSVALTFSNHPSAVLRNIAPPIISSLPLKRALIDVQETIIVNFTESFAHLTFEEFLEPYPIQHLVLGEDAAFGKGCLGTPDALRLLGLKRGFTVHALPKLCWDGKPISSTRIRVLIAQGKLKDAEELLGRPHCFYYSPQEPLQRLALPPDGEYPVWLHSETGVAESILRIENQLPVLSKATLLVSFGPNLNPLLFEKVCQMSPVAS
jgi:hypothetical protein